MSSEVYSIGHATHSIEQFLELLSRHDIKTLADIRRFPGSRKFPHFNQNDLATSLRDAGIAYRWIELLGGLVGAGRLDNLLGLKHCVRRVRQRPDCKATRARGRANAWRP